MINSYKKNKICKQFNPNDLVKPHTPRFPAAITYMCVSGGKKFSFLGIFAALCFLVIPVLKFALLSYYQQIIQKPPEG